MLSICIVALEDMFSKPLFQEVIQRVTSPTTVVSKKKSKIADYHDKQTKKAEPFLTLPLFNKNEHQEI